MELPGEYGAISELLPSCSIEFTVRNIFLVNIDTSVRYCALDLVYTEQSIFSSGFSEEITLHQFLLDAQSRQGIFDTHSKNVYEYLDEKNSKHILRGAAVCIYAKHCIKNLLNSKHGK